MKSSRRQIWLKQIQKQIIEFHEKKEEDFHHDSFGSYIMNMRRVPGAEFHNEKEEKRKEKELFETIDDYVEQA